MVKPTIVIKDDFAPEFIDAYARMIIAFGRLERVVALSIKNLMVLNKFATSYTDGIIEALKKRDFGKMCTLLEELFEMNFGKGPKLTKLKRGVDHLRELAKDRNNFVHGTWTVEGGKSVLFTMRYEKKSGKKEDKWIVPLATVAALHTAIAVAASQLQHARKSW